MSTVITFSDRAKNAALNAVVDLLDAGGGASPTVDIVDADDVVLCTHNLNNPAFGSAASGIVQATGWIMSAGVAVSGAAAKFKLKDKDGVVVLTGSLTYSPDNNLVAGQTSVISNLMISDGI